MYVLALLEMTSNLSQDGTVKLNVQVIFTSATNKNVITLSTQEH